MQRYHYSSSNMVCVGGRSSNGSASFQLLYIQQLLQCLASPSLTQPVQMQYPQYYCSYIWLMPVIILFQFLYIVTVVATGFHLCIHNMTTMHVMPQLHSLQTMYLLSFSATSYCVRGKQNTTQSICKISTASINPQFPALVHGGLLLPCSLMPRPLPKGVWAQDQLP